MQIYILPQKLWCSVFRKYPNGKTTFSVINGAWRGSIHGDELTVSQTEFKVQGQRIAWEGEAPFSLADYNDAISWIEGQLQCQLPD